MFAHGTFHSVSSYTALSESAVENVTEKHVFSLKKLIRVKSNKNPVI